MENLGEMLGVKTPLITSIINIASKLVNQDLRSNARDLRRLNLQGLSKKELLDQVRTGGKDKKYFLD